MIKMYVNKKSIRSKLDLLDEYIQQEAGDYLGRFATGLAQASPVDTGAFVTSWSALPPGNTGGRSRTSKGKPRRQSPEEKRAVAVSQMGADLAMIDLTEVPYINFRNRAPHAAYVNGKWAVIAKAKDRAR